MPEAAPWTQGDLEALAVNLARLVEESGKVAAAYLKPREAGEANGSAADQVADAVKTLGHVAEYWLSDPARAVSAQTAFTSRFIELWGSTLRRFSGENAGPLVPVDPADRRFAAPEWRDSPFFDFVRQTYTLSTRWAEDLVGRAETLDPHTREKAKFYVKQIAAALAPSNFLATNPELLRQTLEKKGENLVRGMHMLAEDIAAGKGNLRLRQTDESKFELGVNTAMTPGKVIYRDDLMELIQYAPTTETVYKRPLLIVPPWINKYYVLDLSPEKSFIGWAVDQGLTVFVISWVNPDERHADKSFEHYMREGILAAMGAIDAATGEADVALLGYCVGGTLLAVTLAYMAATGDTRAGSATLLATQVDFTDAGDLKVFVDEDQIRSIEVKMAARGYLDGASMANAFNMLRPNDLIWPYFVNNYLKGNAPLPFDLLAWNADATRMPAANHSFYLRNCYLENRLSKGTMSLDNTQLDLSRVKVPIYNLATKEDHIAPAESVFYGSKFFGGPVKYVLAGSGHIAGVINPPALGKYQYWTNDSLEAPDVATWLKGASEHKGSWWPDWRAWI
ncbi:MAG: class I poly(R)-hydroxyalkanoic acid synthase, partial [Methylobacteriaceae bacterium]|nr:class I poly(R)-hydroxyalkanoic acid synthase [Methylobacteriaceae bacterium]